MDADKPEEEMPVVSPARDTFDVFPFLLNVFQKMQATGTVSRDFGSGDILSYAEIKIIMMIGRNPGMNITGLAKSLDISKSAISQMSRKLAEKNLVKKYHDPTNDKEVMLCLTPRGRISYYGYDQFHAKFDEIMEQNLGSLSDEEINTLAKVTRALEKTSEWFRQYQK